MVTDASTPVDIDTLYKKPGVELGWIPDVHHEGLNDQHPGRGGNSRYVRSYLSLIS